MRCTTEKGHQVASGNSSMTEAKRSKNDEFYTRIEDIENELGHYAAHFRDKVVFLNCDDPEASNFWRYFELNFEFLGLKKLIATHYDAAQPTYKLELVRSDVGGDTNGDGVVDGQDVVRTELQENGDFRSSEAVALLQEADIVVTNPPFSLFREYLAQLAEHNKKFLIVGNMNAITYRETWTLIQDGKLWLGTRIGDMSFRVPESYGPRSTRFWIDDEGNHWRSLGNATWFTNLDHSRRHEEIVLFRRYAEDPSLYPTYANYDAIEVSKVADIPEDYSGEMGVPITFLGKHNPDQFEIVGYSGQLAKNLKDYVHPSVKFTGGGLGAFYVPVEGGYRRLYDRIVIKRKNVT